MLHVDLLIGEELRLIQKSNWSSIAIPMLVQRRPGFRNRPEYQERTDLDEETKIICITSNHTGREWFNTLYNNTFTNYFKNMTSDNRVYSVDIFPAIRHGLKSVNWFYQQEQDMDEFSFRTEILNETMGEIDGAYFPGDLFRKNQIIAIPWYPLTNEEISAGIDNNREKNNNEIRLIFMDFAWAGDNGTNINDQIVLGCMSLQPSENKLYRYIEYIETYSGSQASLMPLRIRELFWDYKSDYIVLDQRSGGEILYNQLTAPMPHPNRNEDEWNSHGFTVCSELDLHMVTSSKLDDLRERTIDPEAIPCIIPVIGNPEWNSEMWIDLKSRLKHEEIAFLIDELEFKSEFEGQTEWFKLTSEERTLKMLPYTQNMMCIHEATNLSQEWREGKLKLKEPRRGTKDRIVAVGYANSIANKIENKKAKEAQQEDSSLSEWDQLVY